MRGGSGGDAYADVVVVDGAIHDIRRGRHGQRPPLPPGATLPCVGTAEQLCGVPRGGAAVSVEQGGAENAGDAAPRWCEAGDDHGEDAVERLEAK